MEHLYFRQAACVVFLLLMGATRYYYFVAAGRQPADRSGPLGNWARHIPAYFMSAAWIVYVAWRILVPARLAQWDRWPLDHQISDLLGWAAILVLIAAFSLFWYGHHTIGRYWSIRIGIKQAHRLVTRGPYDYIRHPLYTALFLGYLGTLLALQSWMLTAWFPVFVASYLLFAKEEESIMERGFGEAYRVYRRRTGMFLPRWPRILADVRLAVTEWRAARNKPQRQILITRNHDHDDQAIPFSMPGPADPRHGSRERSNREAGDAKKIPQYPGRKRGQDTDPGNI